MKPLSSHRGLLIACALLGVGAFSADARAGQPAKKPNIIFILIDDMGWTDLGCQGSKFYHTPNIDKLAKLGMRFTSGYAACPVCSPTRASLLTGKYSARLNITNFFTGAKKGKMLPAPYLNYLPLDEETIAEALRQAGYATGMIGKWHLGGAGYEPTRQGFDVNIGGNKAGSPASYFSPFKNPDLKDGPKGQELTDRLTDEALTFIDKNKAKPFYLHLCYYAVHIPLQAKEKLIDKYKDRAAKLPDLGPKFAPEGETKVRLVQDHPVYAAMVETLDINIGRIVDHLHKLGIDDNTLIVFTSDNGGVSTSEGWPTSNLPLRAGKGWLYEGGVRVPMLIVWPGHIRPGSECPVPVSSPDFYPTFLEAAGLKARPKQHVDGVSIVPLLQEKGKFPDRALYWHYPHYSNQFGRPSGSVRKGDHVLIEFYEDGKLELYEVAKDIGQKNNLAKQMPAMATQLHKMLVDWRKEVGAKMPTPNPEWKDKE